VLYIKSCHAVNAAYYEKDEKGNKEDFALITYRGQRSNKLITRKTTAK
jgi:hypothetical protein